MRLRQFRFFFALVILNATLLLIFTNSLEKEAGMGREIPDNVLIEVQRPIKTTEEVLQYKTTTHPRSEQAPPMCPSLQHPPAFVPDLQRWLPLIGQSKDIYGFSAFWDDITSPHFVRIIALDNHINRQQLYCQLWYSDNSLRVVSGTKRAIPEDHGRRYRAVYIICSSPIKNRPYAVSIVTGSCQRPSQTFPVQYHTNTHYNFTLCVTPFNFQYGRAYELVEMVEANRLMGADYFVFYNYSTNRNVDQVLKQYSEEGLAETIQWHLPMTVDTYPPIQNKKTEVHYFAQMASLNDCVHRNLHRSKYLVFTDLDELIIPHVHNSWEPMLKSLPESSAYIFKNAFFRKEWPDIEDNFPMKDLAIKYKVLSVLKQKREAKILPHFQRSKYILRPEKVETVGIHNIWALRAKSSVTRVPSSVALLHHYRNWEDYKDKQKRISDKRMSYFQKDLLLRIHERWQKLRDVPMNMLRDFEKKITSSPNNTKYENLKIKSYRNISSPAL